MKKLKLFVAKSRPIQIRLTKENDAYVHQVKEARELASINRTVNRIIENHKTSFVVYRLNAKAEAERLRARAKKLMNDFDLTENDLD